MSSVSCHGLATPAPSLPCITDSVSPGSAAAKVPIELWMKIGQFITAPIDLITLASISPQAMSTAASLVLYPSVMDFRLVDTMCSVSPILDHRKFLEKEDMGAYSDQMGRAKFMAVRGGHPVNVEIGQEIARMFTGRRELSFEIQSYMSGMEGNELYVSELNDKA